MKKLLAMLLCLVLLCGAALAEEMEAGPAEDAEAMPNEIELDLAEDAGIMSSEIGLDLAEEAGESLAQDPVAGDSGAVSNEMFISDSTLTLNNRHVSDTIEFTEPDTNYTLIVKGNCKVDGGLMCIENNSTLTITGGGTLTVGPIAEGQAGIVTNNELLIDNVTIKGAPIWGHDHMTVRNSTLELTDPEPYTYTCIQNDRSSNMNNPYLIIENSKVTANGCVFSTHWMDIENSTVEAVMYSGSAGVAASDELWIKKSEVRVTTADGEDHQNLLVAQGSLILEGENCYVRRKGMTDYYDFLMEQLDSYLYKPGDSYENRGVELVITTGTKKTVKPMVTNIRIRGDIFGGDYFSTPDLVAGKKTQLSFEVFPANADPGKVTWTAYSQDGKKYATITEDGVLTADSSGVGKRLWVNVYAGDGSGKFDSVIFNIVGNPTKITGMSVDTGALGKSPKLLVGKSAALGVKVTPKDADSSAVKWSVDNKKYATISEDGVLTAKAKGAGKTVTVTAKATDGSGKKTTKKIRIVGKVTKIKLKPAAKKVKAGKKVKIKATVKVQKGGSKALAWSVDNEEYAKISAKGVLTAKKAGKGKTIKVTATAKDGSGTKASVKIKIK